MLPDVGLVTTAFERNIYADALNRTTYICDALPGNTDPDEDYWRIQRIYYYGVTRRVKYYRWANGQNEFKFAPNLRTTYAYSNVD